MPALSRSRSARKILSSAVCGARGRGHVSVRGRAGGEEGRAAFPAGGLTELLRVGPDGQRAGFDLVDQGDTGAGDGAVLANHKANLPRAMASSDHQPWATGPPLALCVRWKRSGLSTALPRPVGHLLELLRADGVQLQAQFGGYSPNVGEDALQRVGHSRRWLRCGPPVLPAQINPAGAVTEVRDEDVGAVLVVGGTRRERCLLMRFLTSMSGGDGGAWGSVTGSTPCRRKSSAKVMRSRATPPPGDLGDCRLPP